MKVACPHCHAWNYSTDGVCLSCGARLPWAVDPPQSLAELPLGSPPHPARAPGKSPPSPRMRQAGATAGGVLVGALCGFAPGMVAVGIGALVGSGLGSWGVARGGGTGLEIVSGAAVGAVAGLLFGAAVTSFAPGWAGAVVGGLLLFWWTRPITWREAEARLSPGDEF